MTNLISIPKEALDEPLYPEHVVTGESLSSLMGIFRPEVNLALYKRYLPYGFKGVLQGLLGIDRRALTLKANVKCAFKENFHAAFGFLLESEARDSKWIFEDIYSLTLRFSTLTAHSILDISFEIVETNQCRKFHTDNTGIRLITTYSGPSTQWLENSYIDRRRMGSDEFDVYLRGVPLHQIRTGEVALLKGEAFPGNRSNGIVHKSPEIESSQTKRLVLRIDTMNGDI